MAAVFDPINRAESELVLLHNAAEWLEPHEKALRDAGFTLLHTYRPHPHVLSEHARGREHRRVDLVLFGLDSDAEATWEQLRHLCEVFDGPLLAVGENFDAQVQARALESGAYDYIAVGDLGAEGLELKVETALTAHRFNRLLREDEEHAEQLFVKILGVMVNILDSKDPYTRFHSHSVATMARKIGRRKGFGEDALDRLGLAALLHDFGKIGIPDEILCKPGKLTDEEFRAMKKHAVIARDLLASIEVLHDLLPAIAHHHERWDGKGYPAGLSGAAIPLWSRIIALADTFDTMSSRRAYKEPLSREHIKQEFMRCRGTQFDPELTGIMLALIDEQAAGSEGGE